MEKLHVSLLNHRESAEAACIHDVQMEAYRQEALLLGVPTFPPLNRIAEDVQKSNDQFLGTRLGSSLAGVISISPEGKKNEYRISSLVVLPQYQRLGIGSGLVSAAIAASKGRPLTVMTGVLNEPAIKLYTKFGFMEVLRRRLDSGLLVVELRRA